MAWRFAVTISVVLVLVQGLAPGIGAAGPLQDDAGSGEDAGDHEAVATQITAGTHDAELGAGDLVDHYAFEAPAGRVIEISIPAGDVDAYVTDPEGRVIVHVGPRTTGYAHEDGTWRLTVQLEGGGSLADAAAPSLPYTFSLAFIDPVDAFHVSGDTQSRVSELSWTGPGSLDLRIGHSQVLPADREAVWSTLAIEIAWTTLSGETGRFGPLLTGSTYWLDHPAEAIVPAEIPEEIVHLTRVESTWAKGWHMGFSGPNVANGTIRLVTLGDGASPSSFHQVVTFDQPLDQAATTTAVDRFSWRATTDTSFSQLLDADDVVTFWPPEGHRGTITHPDGSTTEVEGTAYATLSPMPGLWSFDLDRAPGEGQPHGVTVFGAQLPSLGIAT